MTTRITISVPDELAKEIEEIRPYTTVSGVCQKALAQAVVDVRHMKAVHPMWGLNIHLEMDKRWK